jgi:hypothetical protein
MDNHDNSDDQKNTGDLKNGNIDVHGDVYGSGIIIGHHITTGDVLVSINKSIDKNPGNVYLKGLKQLTEKLSEEYEKYNVPEDKRGSINESIKDLENDVKSLETKTEVKDLSLSQQKLIDAKTTTLIEKIVYALPAASEVIANFTPLSPFSKLIRGGLQQIVDAVKKSNYSKS